MGNPEVISPALLGKIRDMRHVRRWGWGAGREKRKPEVPMLQGAGLSQEKVFLPEGG